MINVEALSVSYGDTIALDRVDLAVAARSTCAIIGPTGCGKSTLLYALAGLVRSNQGQVMIGGEPVSSPRSRTSLILQDYGLFPWLTAFGNVRMAAELSGLPRTTISAASTQLLERLGLGQSLHRFPSQLSGGQRQRVAIARALISEPDLLLMDEPFSALDALTRERMQAMIRQQWHERGLTTVLITHSIDEAVYLGEQIVVMTPSPGKIRARLINPCPQADDPRSRPEFEPLCRQLREMLRGDGDE